MMWKCVYVCLNNVIESMKSDKALESQVAFPVVSQGITTQKSPQAVHKTSWPLRANKIAAFKFSWVLAGAVQGGETHPLRSLIQVFWTTS